MKILHWWLMYCIMLNTTLFANPFELLGQKTSPSLSPTPKPGTQTQPQSTANKTQTINNNAVPVNKVVDRYTVRLRVDLKDKNNIPLKGSAFGFTNTPERQKTTTFGKKHDEHKGIIFTLMTAFLNSQVHGYDADYLTSEITLADFNTKYGRMTDQAVFDAQIQHAYCDCWLNELVPVVDLIETQTFDATTSREKIVTEYIILYGLNTIDEPMPLIAFKMSEVAPLHLTSASGSNRFNDATLPSLADLIYGRQFTGTILKKSAMTMPTLEAAEQLRQQKIQNEAYNWQN